MKRIHGNNGLTLDAAPAWVTNALMVDRPLQHVRLMKVLLDAGVNVSASYSEGIRRGKYYSVELLDVSYLPLPDRARLLEAIERLESEEGMLGIRVAAVSQAGADTLLDFVAALHFPLQQREARILATHADEPGVLFKLEHYLGEHGFSLKFRKCFHQTAPYYGSPVFQSYLAAELPEGFERSTFEVQSLVREHGFDITIQWPKVECRGKHGDTDGTGSSGPVRFAGRHVWKLMDLTRQIAAPSESPVPFTAVAGCQTHELGRRVSATPHTVDN